jgi:hypothetical protein
MLAFPVENEKNRWCMWAEIREFAENKAGSLHRIPEPISKSRVENT